MQAVQDKTELTLDDLIDDVKLLIAAHLPTPDLLSWAETSKNNYAFFKKRLP